MLDTSSEFDVLIAYGSLFPAAGFGLYSVTIPLMHTRTSSWSRPAQTRLELTLPDRSTSVFAVTDPGQALITGDVNDLLNFKNLNPLGHQVNRRRVVWFSPESRAES